MIEVSHTFTYEFANHVKAIATYGAHESTYIRYSDPSKMNGVSAAEQMTFSDLLRKEKLKNDPDEFTVQSDAAISQMTMEARLELKPVFFGGVDSKGRGNNGELAGLVGTNGNQPLSAETAAASLGLDMTKVRRETRRILQKAAETGKVSTRDAFIDGMPLNAYLMLGLSSEVTRPGQKNQLFSYMNTIAGSAAGYTLSDEQFMKDYNCSFGANISNLLFARAQKKQFELPPNGELNYSNSLIASSFGEKTGKAERGATLIYNPQSAENKKIGSTLDHVGILLKETGDANQILSFNNVITNTDGTKEQRVMLTSIPKGKAVPEIRSLSA